MGFTFNGLSGAAVTVSGGISPATQTRIVKGEYKSAATNTAYALHTVTTGKKFYLTSVLCGAAAGAVIRIGADMTGNAQQDGTELNDIVLYPSRSDFSQTFTVPVVYNAGEVIGFMSSVAQGTCVTITGYEVTA